MRTIAPKEAAMWIAFLLGFIVGTVVGEHYIRNH